MQGKQTNETSSSTAKLSFPCDKLLRKRGDKNAEVEWEKYIDYLPTLGTVQLSTRLPYVLSVRSTGRSERKKRRKNTRQKGRFPYSLIPPHTVLILDIRNLPRHLLPSLCILHKSLFSTSHHFHQAIKHQALLRKHQSIPFVYLCMHATLRMMSAPKILRAPVTQMLLQGWHDYVHVLYLYRYIKIGGQNFEFIQTINSLGFKCSLLKVWFDFKNSRIN